MRWKDLLAVLCVVAVVAWFVGGPGHQPTPPVATSTPEPAPVAASTPKPMPTPAAIATPELVKLVDSEGKPVYKTIAQPILYVKRVDGAKVFEDLRFEVELLCAGEIFVGKGGVQNANVHLRHQDKSWQFGPNHHLRMFPEEEWPAHKPLTWEFKLQELELQKGSSGIEALKTALSTEKVEFTVSSMVRLPDASPFARSPNLMLVQSEPERLDSRLRLYQTVPSKPLAVPDG